METTMLTVILGLKFWGKESEIEPHGGYERSIPSFLANQR